MAAPKPVWDSKQGVYAVQGGPNSNNPSGKTYFNPQSGQTFFQNAGGTSIPVDPAQGGYWNRIFSPVQGQAPGTTPTGQQFQGQNIMQSPQGTYYYQLGGKNYALNADQLKGMNLPQIAGYDQAGNPYYSTPTAESQNTPETNALADLAKTDPKTRSMIDQLSSYYNNTGKALQSGGTMATPQIQQAARAAQLARGNALGTAQASQEAMSTGLEGENEAQGLASYLNSGTTPMAMGSRGVSDAINQYNASNQNIPFQSTYNPQNTFTYLNPNAGQAFAQGANNWYNQANYQYLGSGAQGGGLSPGMSAGAGALSGAVSGATAGSALGPWGTLGGGVVGGLAGGLGGYAKCWVAREVYGADNPKWKVFRDWLDEDAPSWFRNLYIKFGPKFAIWIRNKPLIKAILRKLMDKKVEHKLRKEVDYAR